MKQPSRERITERAILITAATRDMEACREHFELYNSANNALEASSGMMTLCKNARESHTENSVVSTLRTWCITEAWNAPITCSDIRKAVADAMRLAKKELQDEDKKLLSDIQTVAECCCSNTYIDYILFEKIQCEYGDKMYVLNNAIEEYIYGALDEGDSIQKGLSVMKQLAKNEYLFLLGTVGESVEACCAI
tara:strand:- start:2611 stop:3189 length:579 start_codon:yes stop_codon:yes gene_type:complete